MNERIKKLADKIWSLDIEPNPHFQLCLQSFAESIVQECASICEEMSAKCAGLPGDGALAQDCANYIRQDFGVEE